MSAAIRPTVVPSPWGHLCTVIGTVFCMVRCMVLCGVFRTAVCAVPWVGITAACLVPSAATVGETVPAPVREIGSRRELFVDEWLIDRLQNVTLRMHRPQPGEVAIVCDAPWEGNTSAYFTLFADGDRFRMYYRGAHFDEQAKQPTHPEFTCLAESRDGIRWEKPRLGLFEFAGSKENNIVWAGAETHNFTPFKDTNPACPADARYKALGGGHVRWGARGCGRTRRPTASAGRSCGRRRSSPTATSTRGISPSGIRCGSATSPSSASGSRSAPTASSRPRPVRRGARS